MKPQSVKKRKKIKIGKGLRLQVYAWCMVVGTMFLFGMTYAWYSLQIKEAETTVANVMKPYHLTIQNSAEAASEQLAIGSLQQGEKKQILFSVTNAEEPQVNKNKTAFEYALELIYTNNLALNYQIYQLSEVDEDGDDIIALEETDAEGNTTYRYFKKEAMLSGEDVSSNRYSQVELTDTDDIVNRGTYIQYQKTTDALGAVVNDNLKLEVAEDDSEVSTYATQYFVLEISWSITSGFEKYDKETDMIYIVAKAVQPKPEE